jgi:NodT family efflux transporter outer membrane factor (OMF) lipoprotein
MKRRHLAPRALLLLLAASGQPLAGCATAPLRHAQATLPASYEADARSAVGERAANQAWWRGFGDPELNALIEQALVASPDARSARAVLQEAQAVRSSALAGFRPQGAPALDVARRGESLDRLGPRSDTVSLTVSWEVDFLGRRQAAKAGADAALQAAAFDHEASRVALAAAVAQGYLELHGLRRQHAEAIETTRIAEELARLGALKAQRGVLSRADQASLAADAAGARAASQALLAQEQAARRGLLVLVGRGAESRDQLRVATAPLSAPSPPASLPGDLLGRRPDLLAAGQRVKVAASAVVSAKLAQLPTLTLAPGLSDAGAGALWTLAANATTPLLDLPRLRSQVRIADARGEQAVLAYERAVQVAYGEADRALLQLASDRLRLADLVEAEAQAKIAFDGQSLAFRAGYADLSGLLLAERGWRAARVALVAGQTDVLSDSVTAFKALGGGWSPAAASTLSSVQR